VLVSNFWQSAALLAVAQYEGEILYDMTDAARILRAFAAIDIRRQTVQELAVLLYADQLLVPDTQGNVALHLAARSAMSMPMHGSLIARIVEANPAAASIRNAAGDIPLSVALRAPGGRDYLQWPNSIGPIVEAYPAALYDLEFWNDSLLAYILASMQSPSARFRTLQSLF
jgi:hypothetical protein